MRKGCKVHRHQGSKPFEARAIDVLSAPKMVLLPACVVIDTNVILDMFLYQDPRVVVLRDALTSGELQWLATRVMREELARVLKYEHILKRLLGWDKALVGVHPDEALAEAAGLRVLARMDQEARYVEVAARASYVCKDVDDQKFIDLAQAHQTLLISKDKAVLSMKNRMARVGVQIMSVYAKASSLKDDVAPAL